MKHSIKHAPKERGKGCAFEAKHDDSMLGTSPSQALASLWTAQPRLDYSFNLDHLLSRAMSTVVVEDNGQKAAGATVAFVSASRGRLSARKCPFWGYISHYLSQEAEAA